MKSEIPVAASIVGFATLVVVFYWYFMSRPKSMGVDDPYGLFHLALNRLPGEDASKAPKTEWLNMGYWKVKRYT